MAAIKCCERNNKSRGFIIKAQDGFSEVKLFYLEKCTKCNNTVVVLKRLDVNNEWQQLRMTGAKASDLYKRLQPDIIEDLDKPLKDTEYDLNHGEFTKILTKVVNDSGTVLETWKTKPMVTTYQCVLCGHMIEDEDLEQLDFENKKLNYHRECLKHRLFDELTKSFIKCGDR